MKRYITAILFTTLFLVSAETNSMKCESGKCSQGTKTNTKKIPKKDTPKVVKPTIIKKIKKDKVKNTTHATVKQLFNVRLVTVEERSVAKEQVNYGYIVARDSAKVDVLPWYSGFVKKLYTNTLYTKVKKGDALAKVYSPEVYKAKQDYLNSINYNKKASMPAMLKSAKVKLKLLGVDEKEIKCIETDHYADYYTTIYAPISGWIFEKNINEGASFGTTKRLFQIVNLDKVWVEVKLFQNELLNLNRLSHFKVNIKGLEKTYMAKKELLYPVLNPKEATATLRLAIDNKDELLKTGMYAKVHSVSKTHTRLVIPRTSAMRKNGTWYVFLATEFKGEYEPLEVKVKPLDNKSFEILSGLRKGDSIVNNALFMMDSDAQINSIY